LISTRRLTDSRMSYGAINESIHDYARQKDVSEVVSSSLHLVYLIFIDHSKIDQRSFNYYSLYLI